MEKGRSKSVYMQAKDLGNLLIGEIYAPHAKGVKPGYLMP